MGDSYSTRYPGSYGMAGGRSSSTGISQTTDISNIDDDELPTTEMEEAAAMAEQRRNVYALRYMQIQDARWKQYAASHGKKAKTKSFRSVTGNKMHAAVFPNMRVPIHMRKTSGKKAGSYGASSCNVFALRNPVERVPVMSVQCPFPGGTAVTNQTDPVMKLTWGPHSRVEASGEAIDLVKEWQQASKALKKMKAKGKGKKECGMGKAADSATSTDSDSEGEEGSKLGKVKNCKTKSGAAGTRIVDKGEKEDVSSPDVNTPDTASVADTDFTTEAAAPGNPNRRGILIPPPPSPPESIFAAVLSQPTLPHFHPACDMSLIEQYRTQHLAGPQAFETKTRAIKKSLLDAKVARGGEAHLLKNEYSVELATREAAETAENWARGQRKKWELEGLRSRGNSLLSGSSGSPMLEELKMRGGEITEGIFATSASIAAIMENGNVDPTTADALATSSPALRQVEDPVAFERLPPPASDKEDITSTEPKSDITATTAKKMSSYSDLISAMRSIKNSLSKLDLSEHVSKVTTSGTVRYQHSVRREVGDHGEKREVKTWIEVVEVYDVPHAEKLTLKDVAKVIETQKEECDTDSDWESDGGSDSDVDGSDDQEDAAEKEIMAVKMKNAAAGKGKDGNVSSSSTTSTDTDTATATDSGSASACASGSDNDAGPARPFTDPNETEAEALFRSLARVGRGHPSGIDAITNDLQALIAGLRNSGMLTVTEE